jgi:CheY-like chemotaxis protein
MAIPGLTGLRVAKDMRADRAAANSLLIAMSGSVDARLRERARSAGFDRFLVKPCSIDEIREIIAPLCLVARHDEDKEKRTES